MSKGFKRVGTGVLSGVLWLGVASTAFGASGAAVGPATVEPGRTVKETGVGTGVLKAGTLAELTYNKETSVLLTGTVVIDGPKLVMKLTRYPQVQFSIVKVADKLFAYTAVLPLGADDKGKLDLSVEAYTVYQNGKTAGQIHSTVAGPVSAGHVHVAYIKEYQAVNAVFGTYNRTANTFPFSYTLNKVWDDGHVEVSGHIVEVQGTTEVYGIVASDPAYKSGAAPVTVRQVAVPVVLKDTEITVTDEPVYDRMDNRFTYTYHRKDTNSRLKETLSTGTAFVEGTETGSIDVTYGDGTQHTVYTFVPPVKPRFLTIDPESVTYTYNGEKGTYDAAYTMVEEFSDGTKAALHRTATGLAPAGAGSIHAEIDGLEDVLSVQVPAAPLSAVTDAEVTGVTGVWAGNHNVSDVIKVSFTLTYKVNGQLFSVELHRNVNPASNGTLTVTGSYTASHFNQTVTVPYTVTVVAPAPEADTSSSENGVPGSSGNNGGNGNGYV